MGIGGRPLKQTPTEDIIIPNTHNMKTSNSKFGKILTHKYDPRINAFRAKIFRIT